MIGVSKDPKGSQHEICSAEANARWMAAILQALGHVPPDGHDSILMLNPTKQQMLAAVEAFNAAALLNHKRTWYYDGHGCTDRNGRLLTAAADGAFVDAAHRIEVEAHKGKSPVLIVSVACRQVRLGQRIRAAASALAGHTAAGCCSSATEYSQHMYATRRGATSYGHGDSRLPSWAMWFFLKHSFLRCHPAPRHALQAARDDMESFRLADGAPGEVMEQMLVFNGEDDDTSHFTYGHVSPISRLRLT